MILAAMILLAVGTADLVRRFWRSPRRWIAYTGSAAAFLVFAATTDALGWGIFALVAAAGWVVSSSPEGTGRMGLWPVGLLGVIAAGAVALAGPRATATAGGALWMLPGADGAVPVDQALLALGAVVFLLESANVVVRTALRGESVAPVSEDGAVPAVDAAGPPMPSRATGLKGGRLIGPLERVLVFALTLAGAYTLLAAVLAAKGIVRFPEISRDSDSGDRAEYFLIGSLVSWVMALACAFLVWWGAAQV